MAIERQFGDQRQNDIVQRQNDIVQQHGLLTIHRGNLAGLIRQAAMHGGEVFAPIHVVNSIREARDNIQRIKGILRGWGEEVEDHPDDISPEERARQQKLLATYRRILADWIDQAAAYGSEVSAPPPIRHGINEARENIRHIKGILRGWSVAVEDHPNDISPEERARRLFKDFPPHTIPDIAPLLPGSRMELSHNPLFVGRENDLLQLAEAIKGDEANNGQVRTVAVTGMGGIGKTQLAIEFVHRYGQYFAGGVFWLNFADVDRVPTEIAACGGVAALELSPDFESLPMDTQVRRVLAAWRSPLPRLLVFDNCEDENLLARWRPPHGICRVLITSRRAYWDPMLGIIQLRLSTLGRAASIELLRQYRPDIAANDNNLNALARELGDMPLALHLAGRYLARYRNSVTPAVYLGELRHPNLLQHPSMQVEGIAPNGHMLHVARTFALSYERLNPASSIDALARQLLGRAEYFWRCTSSEPVVPALLLTMLDPAGDRPDQRGHAADALNRLTELGLLETTDSHVLPMHHLLAEFVRAVAPDPAPRAPVVNALRRRMEDEDLPDEERRVAALQLIRMDWMTDAQDISADELLTQLELIAYTVDSPIQRPYLIDSITRFLPPTPEEESTLDKRQQSQLLRYRAMMHGQMGGLEKDAGDIAKYLERATTDYEAAWTIIARLIESEDSQPEDLKMAARIKIGAGTVAIIQAERLSKPEEKDCRQAKLQKGAVFYEEADIWAQKYGQDAWLTMSIYRELIYTYALLQNWEAAKEYYRAALLALKSIREQTYDNKTYVIDFADVLDAASNLHWQYGQNLIAQNNRSLALREYKKAYYLARKGFRALKKFYLVSEPLVFAHYNAGKYRLAIGECSGDITSQIVDESCQDWEIALHMAHTLGMAEMERKADQRLQQHCRNGATAERSIDETQQESILSTER